MMAWRSLVLAAALWVAMALLAAACLTAGGGGDGDGGEATPTAQAAADTPEAVIQLYVEKLLNRLWAGDCRQATGEDRGALCVTKRGERGRYVAYNLGPTFSDPSAIVLLKRSDEGVWEIESVIPRDPNQPDDGSTPWPLEVGEIVVVAGTGDCLNVREEPRIDARILFCRPDGWKFVIQEGPVERDGYVWWRLGGEGWAVQDYLRYPEDAPLPQNTPAPQPTQAGG